MARSAFARLIRELARLRGFRDQRRRSIPLRFALRWYQRRLIRKLFSEWRESYVLLDEGDFVHIPTPLDMHGELALTQAPGFPAILGKFCRPGSTAIDAGANIGQWSLPMARLVGPSGRLFAFEPMPRASGSLRKTFRVNGFRHAEAYPLALSDVEGRATLHMASSATGIVDSGVSSLERQAPGSTPIEVQTVTLDEFLKDHEIPPISFIKIDVEGHEARVLAGARLTLRRHRPALVIETGFEPAAQREVITSILREAGYEPIGVLHDRHIAPATWADYLDASSPFEKRALNLLLLPCE